MNLAKFAARVFNQKVVDRKDRPEAVRPPTLKPMPHERSDYDRVQPKPIELKPRPTGPTAPVEGVEAVNGLAAQALQNPAPRPKPDLTGAMIFGRPVDPRSSHDLFWHYFGNRPSPTNNEQARAMMAEMKEKFEPFGFKVEPVEHERMDKVNITGPDGKLEHVDFIYAMGGTPGEQRLQWLASNPIGPGADGGTVDQTFVSGILSMFEPTNDGIRKAVEELRKKKGYENARLLEHPQRLDKIDFGNGRVVDVIIGAGGPNPRWGWLPE